MFENKKYTDEEVWAFFAPKMSQFTNTDFVDNEVMKMVVTVYRSGYGRATKRADRLRLSLSARLLTAALLMILTNCWMV